MSKNKGLLKERATREQAKSMCFKGVVMSVSAMVLLIAIVVRFWQPGGPEENMILLGIWLVGSLALCFAGGKSFVIYQNNKNKIKEIDAKLNGAK